MSEFKRFSTSQHVIQALESGIPLLAQLPYEIAGDEVRIPLATWNQLNTAQRILVQSILDQEGYGEIIE